MINTRKLPRLISVSAILAGMVFISGCSQSLDRRDSISASFGNAMASNTALQTVDPWPRRVEDTHIHTDGVKAENAIESYRTPPEIEGAESAPAETSLITPAN